MDILIKHVLLNGREQDILIVDRFIKDIADSIDVRADVVIDGKAKIALPPFFNGHTHAAMVLLRGYADDISLDKWLNDKIWPIESRMTEEDIYWGTRLACLEMIKSGVTFFNDMYWHYHGVARAVEDSGIRGAISAVFIDGFDVAKSAQQIELNRRLFEETAQYSERVAFALGPHAIYTVSEKSLRWAKEFAAEHDLLIHIHLSETEKEVADCRKRHHMRPIEYLDHIGFLGPNVVAAHVIWVADNEITLLKKHAVNVVYNATSNMKLSAGIFPYERLADIGVNIILGTDGCASNNNLDILEEMKFAALLQKMKAGNPAVLSAQDVYNMATKYPASVFDIKCAEIKSGNVADMILVDLHNIRLVPNHHIIPNLVYSATDSCIDTTICDGIILMQNGTVAGEEEVRAKAQEAAFRLTAG